MSSVWRSWLHAMIISRYTCTRPTRRPSPEMSISANGSELPSPHPLKQSTSARPALRRVVLTDVAIAVQMVLPITMPRIHSRTALMHLLPAAPMVLPSVAPTVRMAPMVPNVRVLLAVAPTVLPSAAPMIRMAPMVPNVCVLLPAAPTVRMDFLVPMAPKVRTLRIVVPTVRMVRKAFP